MCLFHEGVTDLQTQEAITLEKTVRLSVCARVYWCVCVCV